MNQNTAMGSVLGIIVHLGWIILGARDNTRPQPIDFPDGCTPTFGLGRIAMRPDDDLALGHPIKNSGFRQKFAGGTNLLKVQWYGSLREMARGSGWSRVPYAVAFVLEILLFCMTRPYSGVSIGWRSASAR